jgi:5-methylcytosine-specific restriction endonuclease McrA
MGSVIASPLIVRRPDPCGKCGITTSELRRFTCSNGTFQVRRQCTACGSGIGNPIPHYQVDDIKRLPAWDTAPADREKTLIADREIERLDKKAAEDREWRKRYNAHLSSAEWRALADRVLRRAGFVCEGCLEQRATQVHHMTYDHLGAEFAFELRALCKPCHDRFHEKTP